MSALGRKRTKSDGQVRLEQTRWTVCMNGQICWHVELVIKPGRLESFQALTGELVDAARRKLGILSYQRFVGEDGKTVHVYERYADSTAALTYLGIFAKKFAEPFQDMVERKCFFVFGYPTAELKEALDGYGAIYFKPLGDFTYWGWEAHRENLSRLQR